MLRPTLLAGAALVLILVPGCSSGSIDSRSGSDGARSRERPSITAQGARIERVFVGPAARIDDIEAAGNSVAVLASTAAGRADLVLHSGDEGRTWQRSAPGLPGPAPGTEPGTSGGSTWMLGPGQPMLLHAGSTLFATRTWSPSQTVPTGPRLDQAIRASNDGGATWSDVELPVPVGHTAIVSAAGEVAGTIVLGGTVQRNRDDGTVTGPPSSDLDAYDAAIWTSLDGGRRFELVEGSPFAGRPGMQVVRSLIRTGDRLVALGWDTSGLAQTCCFPFWRSTSWASADARRWVALDGLEPGEAAGEVTEAADVTTARLRGTDLEVGDAVAPMVLRPGSNRWTKAEPRVERTDSDQFSPDAHLILLGDHRLVGTWTADAACDCEVANAGRIETGDHPKISVSALTFDGCADRSVRGQTGVADPRAVGDAVGALAWCNDDDQFAAAWAGSTDGGASWRTTRLTALAPPGSSDLVVPERPSVTALDAVSDDVVVALQGRPEDDAADRVPGPIVLLRVEPA
jgi:hypothetical protein